MLPQTTKRYALNISAVIGEPIRLVGGDLVAAGGPVGSVSLRVPGVLAHMVSANGGWTLTRRRRFGWDLLIERQDGQHVGWYEGWRWLAGGTISMTDGTQAELRRDRRRSPLFGWKLQATDTGGRYAEIHCPGRLSKRSITLSLQTLPDTAFADVVVLTSCAVLRLQQEAANLASMVHPAPAGG